MAMISGTHTYFQWLIAFALTALTIDLSNMDNTMVYCSLVTSRTNGIMSITTRILAIGELAAISCYFALLFINKRRKHRLITANLSEKYQVTENIRAIQLLIPTVVAHALVFIPALCFYGVYMMLDTNIDTLNFPLIIESTSWSPIYSVVLPLVLFWRNRALRFALRKTAKLDSLDDYREDEPANFEQEAHFKALASFWASAREQNQTAKKNDT